MPELFQRIAKEAETPPESVSFTPGESFIAKTLQGLEPVLLEELRALGATDLHPLKRAVAFRGDRRLMYRANYESRTALRILAPIHRFSAYNERDLYEAVREVDWSVYMDANGALAVDAVTAGKVFTHSHYAALKTKDAIVDQFRERFGRRPDVDVFSPDIRVNVRINGTQCDILLDASGDSLHKRGYRRESVEAPLNEVLAAGMIAFSGWKGESAFADPMCGSGTLAIEAAMSAMNIPPQYRRELRFGFTRWKDFDAALWKSVQSEAEGQIKSLAFPILASDRDNRARKAVASNLVAAGLDSAVQVEKAAFEQLEPPAPSGVLMFNPPYDERLELAAAADYYKDLGDTLKKRWQGWSAWIISANKEALKHFGLRASRKIPLMNAQLECSFQRFDLYAGSKKQKAAEE